MCRSRTGGLSLYKTNNVACWFSINFGTWGGGNNYRQYHLQISFQMWKKKIWSPPAIHLERYDTLSRPWHAHNSVPEKIRFGRLRAHGKLLKIVRKKKSAPSCGRFRPATEKTDARGTVPNLTCFVCPRIFSNLFSANRSSGRQSADSLAAMTIHHLETHHELLCRRASVSVVQRDAYKRIQRYSYGYADTYEFGVTYRYILYENVFLRFGITFFDRLVTNNSAVVRLTHTHTQFMPLSYVAPAIRLKLLFAIPVLRFSLSAQCYSSAIIVSSSVIDIVRFSQHSIQFTAQALASMSTSSSNSTVPIIVM